MKKMFFGWSNIRWGIKELIKMYSSDKSFFSKKRIESGIAFIILQWGMIHYLIKRIDSIDMTSFVMWAAVEATIAGWMITQIQKDIKQDPK